MMSSEYDLPTLPGFNQNNSTANPITFQNTSSCKWDTRSAVTVYSFTAAFAATFIVSLVGNVMVIWNSLKRGQAKSPFHCLIINMATADLIDCLFAIPLWVAYLHVGLQWIAGAFGVFLCKLTYYAMSVSITSSVLTFSVIAADRYLAIVSSSKIPLSQHAVKWSIAGVWIASAVIFSTDLYTTQLTVSAEQAWCSRDEQLLGGYMAKVIVIIQLLLGYIVPLLVMTVLYSAILRFLYKWQIPGNKSERNSRHVHRCRKKTVKKLVTIVIVFALCWFPIHVFHFLGIFNYKVFICIPGVWFLFAGWLAHTNTAINPCLYLYLSKDKKRRNKPPKKSNSNCGTSGWILTMTRMLSPVPAVIESMSEEKQAQSSL